jgi:CubicO group peptidase (beta-lactamase class C family)
LSLDDRIADYVDGWGNGKERATIRHVLTHTGGFPMTGSRFDYDPGLSYAEKVARIAAAPAEWEPGTEAGYHLGTGWIVLGAVVERVDGRPIDRYVRDEILLPAGADDCWIGIPGDVQERYGDRVAPVYWKGHRMPALDGGRLRLVEFRALERHNDPEYVAMVSPGGGTRGPANQLGRVYEALLGFGTRLLAPTTLECMAAAHRWGLRDRIFGAYLTWGLGFQIDFTGGASRRCFGHGGMASSRGLVDRERELVMVMVANGLPSFVEAETRLVEITDAVYSALPADMQIGRRPARLPKSSRLST